MLESQSRCVFAKLEHIYTWLNKKYLSVVTCQHGSQLNKLQNFSSVKNALKYLKLTTKYAGKKVFKLESLLKKVLVHKNAKLRLKKSNLLQKRKLKYLDDF